MSSGRVHYRVVRSEWELIVKKGRHRRFEEARELKRGREIDFDSILNGSGQSADIDDEEDEYEEYKPGSYVNPELD